MKLSVIKINFPKEQFLTLKQTDQAFRNLGKSMGNINLQRIFNGNKWCPTKKK